MDKKTLNDKVLEHIAGGEDDMYITQTECQSCGHRRNWKGNYMAYVGDCPICKAAGQFRGVQLIYIDGPVKNTP